MTEIFSWGYIGWLTRRPDGYELSGYLDGEEFSVVAQTPAQAARMFSRAARRAYLYRQIRVLRGLPARKTESVSSADVHHKCPLVRLPWRWFKQRKRGFARLGTSHVRRRAKGPCRMVVFQILVCSWHFWKTISFSVIVVSTRQRVDMSIYLHPPGEGPEIVYLLHWSIREFDNGKRFFVGFSRDTRDGRVSTAIAELDAVGRRARTASGRIYQLVGLSGYSSDGEYVFSRVAKIIGEGGAWRNVTAALIPDCRIRKPDDSEELPLQAVARFLFTSPQYVRRLIDEGNLPSRIDENGFLRIPLSAVRAFGEKMRNEQREGMEQMMDASERAGLYDAEIENLLVRRKVDDDEME